MRAASLTLTTSFCSSDPEFAEALFQELQDKAVEGLNAMYGTYSSCGSAYLSPPSCLRTRLSKVDTDRVLPSPYRASTDV